MASLEKQMDAMHGEHEVVASTGTRSATAAPDCGRPATAAPVGGRSTTAARIVTTQSGADYSTPPATAAKKVVFLKKGTIGKSTAAVKLPQEDTKPNSVGKTVTGSVETKPKKEESVDKTDDEFEAENDSEDSEQDQDDDDDDEYKPTCVVLKKGEASSLEEDSEADIDADVQTVEKVKKTKKKPIVAKSKNGENISPKIKKDKLLTKTKIKREKSSLGVKKETIRRFIDKKGNVRYKKTTVIEPSESRPEKPNQKPSATPKVASRPQEPDYLKILELAKKNVVTTPVIKRKPMPDPKSILNKMRDAMAEGLSSRPKMMTPIKESTDEEANKTRTNDSSKKTPEQKTSSVSISPTHQTSNANPNQIKPSNLNARSLQDQTQKKKKFFAAALDVPYESLNKNKFARKILNDSKSATPAKSPKIDRIKKSDSQSYKEANKKLLNRLETKLGSNMTKQSSISVDIVPSKNSKNVSRKLSSSNSKDKQKYREEFDEEDEELDDDEEYAPLPPISEENIRRSNRAPKKKSFGDEMIMFDDDRTTNLTDDDDEANGNPKEDDEDDESQHTLKRRRPLSQQNSKDDDKLFVDVEVVDDLKVEPTEQEDEEVYIYIYIYMCCICYLQSLVFNKFMTNTSGV